MNSFSLSSGTLDWLDALQAAVKSGNQSVLVTVLAVKGSVPREPGAKMLVQSTTCAGTIGGGHLEAKIIQKAREMLEIGLHEFQRLKVPLGAALGQCCGGHVEVGLEVVNANNALWVSTLHKLIKHNLPCVLVTSLKIRNVNASVNNLKNISAPEKYIISNTSTQHRESYSDTNLFDYKFAQSVLNEDGLFDPVVNDKVLYEPLNKKLFRLYLFGAGHVGKAVVQALQPLPCDIVWIDSRSEMFSGFSEFENVHVELTDDPLAQVSKITPNAFVVIMTHHHQLDFVITEQVLKQTTASYVGLIGSNTKYQRFKQRLIAKGTATDIVQNLICPIGIDGIRGKQPSQIALSLSAQLLQYAEKRQPGNARMPDTSHGCIELND